MSIQLKHVQNDLLSNSIKRHCFLHISIYSKSHSHLINDICQYKLFLTNYTGVLSNDNDRFTYQKKKKSEAFPGK